MTQPTQSWDDYFLELAKHVSFRSKDPGTKTGAIIVDTDNVIVSSSMHNGFPRKMPDDAAWYADREEKLSCIIHCEMNATIHAQRPLDGCTLYTYPFPSCERCFVHMIQYGITRFVAPKPSEEHNVRWGQAFNKVRLIAVKTGVELVEVDV